MSLAYINIIVVIALISTSSAINVGVSSDAGSSSASFDANLDESINADTILIQTGLRSTISGSGNLKEEHWARYGNKAAGVGVDVINATHYDYGFSLMNQGDSPLADLVAKEFLNVDCAEKINAFSEANASQYDKAISKISIEKGSLLNYYTIAKVDADELESIQGFMQANGDMVNIAAKGSCEVVGVKYLDSKAWTCIYNGVLNIYLGNATIFIPSKSVFMTYQIGNVSNANYIDLGHCPQIQRVKGPILC